MVGTILLSIIMGGAVVHYFVQRPKRKIEEAKVYMLTGKDLSHVLTMGMVVGVFFGITGFNLTYI